MFKNVLLGSGDSMNVKFMNFIGFTRRNMKIYLNPSSNPTESTTNWGRMKFFFIFERFALWLSKTFYDIILNSKTAILSKIFFQSWIFEFSIFEIFELGIFWNNFVIHPFIYPSPYQLWLGRKISLQIDYYSSPSICNYMVSVLTISSEICLHIEEVNRAGWIRKVYYLLSTSFLITIHCSLEQNVSCWKTLFW